MLGDCAVAVNPEDERYKHLIGELVELPLTGRRIPIIADEHADPEFGTGCVKITPAHDFNDHAVWLRHRDENQISRAAPRRADQHLHARCRHPRQRARRGRADPGAYIGMDRYEARKRIVADLEAQGLLAGVKDHKLMVPRGDRSGAVIEPYLTDQWYVKVAAAGRARHRGGRGRAHPLRAGQLEEHLLRVDAQHPGLVHQPPDLVGPSHPGLVRRRGQHLRRPLRAGGPRQARPGADFPLEQDADVLDTWFSSALWPFSTLGWPEDTDRLKAFYPTSVLITGFDIIFFWVARMIMMGLKFMDDVPFRDVYIHGLVRDAQGDKMSKSKGNVLDPIDLIDGIELEPLVEKRTSGMMQPHLAEKIAKQTRKEFPDGIPAFGTDALRFTFAALATTGRDIKFDLGRIEGYRNFCNKLWNASRYVLMNTEGPGPAGRAAQPHGASRAERRRPLDHRRLHADHATVRDAIDGYRFDLAAQAIYEFTWNQFCDWYLELCKPVLTGEQAIRRRQARHPPDPGADAGDPAAPRAPVHALHHRGDLAEGRPARRRQRRETIMLAPYPVADAAAADPDAVAEIEWVQQFILGVRRIKGEMNIPPGKPLPVLVANASERDRAGSSSPGPTWTSSPAPSPSPCSTTRPTPRSPPSPWSAR
jgi:valyl-tRNA synthetase